jgi:flagellar motor protein MotB
MMKKKSKRSISSDENLWLISYSDLITSILAVLVLVMSFSKIDIEKIDHANRLMKDDSMVTLATLTQQYEQLIEKKNLQKYVNVLLDEDGLRVNMASTVQFGVNSAVINQEKIQILKDIFDKIVKDSKQREIIIIGHTDNTGAPQRNWELSSQRANAVMLYLMKKGLDYKHAHIVAYASNKPWEPKKEQSVSLKEKRAYDRRVTILIGRSHL